LRTCFSSPKKPEQSINHFTDTLIAAGYRTHARSDKGSAGRRVSAFFVGPDGIELFMTARPADPGADIMVGAATWPQ
jgi:hypothetical protein